LDLYGLGFLSRPFFPILPIFRILIYLDCINNLCPMSYKHILLIEDDEADQRIFSTVLHSIGPGLSCTVLEDAQEALYKLETAEVAADLIFLDLRMPGMTGLEFLKELRDKKSLSQTPVVVLSGVPDENDARESKALGARDYIVKPGRYSELREILFSILL
jgi:CheY-like chemotaxis protein